MRLKKQNGALMTPQGVELIANQKDLNMEDAVA